MPKLLLFLHPELAKELLQKITTTTIAYLREKVKAGADVIQLFDSWGGLLTPVDYQVFHGLIYNKSLMHWVIRFQ